ncbi:MAG: disulfide bond formation protein DsbC [Candidatus Koribacter versatilis]|uniref:Disulfide bond formation protein DsbC n=1 Tax=Candidatus Korobacter versatilis TaxID=658062 RepID=A0A932A7K3_9BACT|nr:disulfide bond formation protein DsbC [Candidatus Koribacter versatilis]
MKRSLLLTLVCAALAAAQSLSPGTNDQFVTMAPVKKLEVASGRPAVLELDFRVKDGMHVNSSTPKSEFLIPTKLRFMPPTDLAVGKIQYPNGEELALSFSPKDKLSVYSGDFHITAQVSASRSATTGPYTVHGELKYQACNDKACFPPKTLPIAFNVVVGKPVAAGGVTQQREPSTRKNTPQSPHIHK